jgi:hypothetical protein
MLAEIYNSFGEGFGTADLRDVETAIMASAQLTYVKDRLLPHYVELERSARSLGLGS